MDVVIGGLVHRAGPERVRGWVSAVPCSCRAVCASPFLASVVIVYFLLEVQMILDGKLAGTLDAGEGCLQVFDDAPSDGVYPAALDTLRHMGAAIDTLAARSQRVAA